MVLALKAGGVCIIFVSGDLFGKKPLNSDVKIIIGKYYFCYNLILSLIKFILWGMVLFVDFSIFK